MSQTPNGKGIQTMMTALSKTKQPAAESQEDSSSPADGYLIRVFSDV